MNYSEETTSFLEETLARFIGDNDLWDTYNSNKEKVHEMFMTFCSSQLPQITID